MKKNKQTTKQRRAHAKKGEKRSIREKKSMAEKYVRAQKKKDMISAKNKKFQEFMNNLTLAQMEKDQQAF